MKGYKSYLMAAGVAVATAAHYLGYITPDMYKMAMGLLGAGSIAALRAGIAKSGPPE